MTLHNEETIKLFLDTMTKKVTDKTYTHEDIETLLQMAESLAMDVKYERRRAASGVKLISDFMSRGAL